MGKFKNYTYFAVAALLSIAGNAKASDTMENPDSAQDVTVSNVRIERSESFLNCNFTINFADKNLGSNRELRLNPVIIGNNGTETALPALMLPDVCATYRPAATKNYRTAFALYALKKE